MPAFRTLAVMRWSDMDALGHVHNGRFMEYYEAARAELVQRLLAETGDPAGVGLVVRRHEVDYLVPLVYRPAPVVVDTWIAKVGTSSVTLVHQAGEEDGSVVYGRATTTLVAVDAETGASRALPTTVRAALERYQALDAVPAAAVDS